MTQKVKDEQRKERLAQALRDNLKRRKAQSRARIEDGETAIASAVAPECPTPDALPKVVTASGHKTARADGAPGAPAPFASADPLEPPGER